MLKRCGGKRFRIEHKCVRRECSRRVGFSKRCFSPLDAGLINTQSLRAQWNLITLVPRLLLVANTDERLNSTIMCGYRCCGYVHMTLNAYWWFVDVMLMYFSFHLEPSSKFKKSKPSVDVLNQHCFWPWQISTPGSSTSVFRSENYKKILWTYQCQKEAPRKCDSRKVPFDFGKGNKSLPMPQPEPRHRSTNKYRKST